MKSIDDMIEDRGFQIMHTLKVSVIIPVYNAQKYLRQSLDDILGQTLKNIEVICVDDGSTDHSLEILKEYAQKDHRLVIVQQQNQGAGFSRNKGMSLAKGEFLSFLDADDIFKSDMLEKMVHRAEETKADIIICRANIFCETTNQTFPYPQVLKLECLPSKEVFNYKDIPQYIFEFSSSIAWNKLYRYDFIRTYQLQFQTLHNANDLFFVWVSLMKAEKIAIVNQVLVTYRIGVQLSLSRTREKHFLCFYEALKMVKKVFLETRHWGIVEQSFINYSVEICLWQFHSLKYPQKYYLYQKYRKEIFATLGFLDKKEEYFHHKGAYQEMMQIVKNPFFIYGIKKVYQTGVWFLKKLKNKVLSCQSLWK